MREVTINRSLGRATLFLAALLATPAFSPAGPVPGVESISKRPVEFPTPPSITAWDIGNDEYLVTFRWKTTLPTPGVAGAFNNWDRKDLPMSGPDKDGFMSVTARMKVGEYEYKFVSGTNDWHVDESNPETRGSSGNSLLRLGISAIVKDAKAAAGDSNIESRAFGHDPASFTYFDVFTEKDVLVRFRTLQRDVQDVSLKLIARDTGISALLPLSHAGSDSLFDFYETHLVLPALVPGTNEAVTTYTFVIRDGTTTVEFPKRFTFRPDFANSPRVPEWAKHAIWYQVMVDRFRDGNAKNNPEYTLGTGRIDRTHPWRSEWYVEQPWEREGGASFWKFKMYERLYGGDFAGVIEKLDYIKRLGVNAIYLNPVFESTNSHKYNARNFNHADDGYGVPGEFAKSMAKTDLKNTATWEFNGSDKELLRLIKEVKKRDMRIIFDGVFNHLGDDATPFLDVKKNLKKSPYAEWYEITSWDPFTYVGWAGFGGLPQFKKDPAKGFADDSLRDYIYAVTKRWMDPNGDGDPSDGIDGWRLDVPMDVPHPFWVEWRKVVKATNPDAYIVGEIWDPAEMWLDGKTFDAVMNYQFAKIAFRFFGDKAKKISASDFDRELGRLRVRYPRAHTYVLQNLYDSHDTDRWVSRLANPDLEYDANNRIQDNGPNYDDKKPDRIHYQRMRLMAVFQATYVGAPMIWYGTEVGMFGADDPRSRMPMWWDDMMPYDSPDYTIDAELRKFFTQLFLLRSAEPVLREGDFETLLASDDQDCIVYLRKSPGQQRAFAVVLNNSGAEQTLTIPAKPSLGTSGFVKPRLAFGKGSVKATNDGGQLTVTVPAVTGLVVRLGN